MAAVASSLADNHRDCAAMLPRESDHQTSDQHANNAGAVSLVLPVMPPGTPPPSHLSAKWLESAMVVFSDAGYTYIALTTLWTCRVMCL